MRRSISSLAYIIAQCPFYLVSITLSWLALKDKDWCFNGTAREESNVVKFSLNVDSSIVYAVQA